MVSLLVNRYTCQLVERFDNIEDDQYTTICGVSRAELRVKKSRFIGLAASVTSEQDAVNFIRSVGSEFEGATHCCYAYSIGIGARKLIRSTDAGEPANSAGKPILLAIESSGFHNVICVVVRYFGGIKLGIGGLIRAYGRTAKDCLKNAEAVVCVLFVRLRMEIPYAHIGDVVKLVSRLKGKILSMSHGEKTRAVVSIRRSMVASLKESIRAINGDIVVSASK